jgi:ABC-type nickel/cobalt efflux system permease component RcnA
VHDHVADAGTLSRRRLLALGFAGGLVPTPTAIVVLLGATAIGRAWFGVALVLAYGLGMAATLVGAGLLLARARRRFELRARGERFLRYATVLPIATAVVVTGSGLWLVARAAASV